MNGMNVKFGLRDMFLDCIRPVDGLTGYMRVDGNKAEIDAQGLKHKELNDLLREAFLNGVTEITINNVFGQRYIGTSLFTSGNSRGAEIKINRCPGNDLGAFLNGHRIIVYGSAQDGVGNTMNDGEIIIHGRAGDAVAMSMRGGKIFIRDNVGYRAAIHMKEYTGKVPVLVIGGTAQDFFGEYMAGGIVIMLGLGLKESERHKANYLGTGMHGGVIYLRGHISKYQLGREVGMRELNDSDREIVKRYVGEFCGHFGFSADEIMQGSFIKLLPVSKRPYGKIYAY